MYSTPANSALRGAPVLGLGWVSQLRLYWPSRGRDHQETVGKHQILRACDIGTVWDIGALYCRGQLHCDLPLLATSVFQVPNSSTHVVWGGNLISFRNPRPSVIPDGKKRKKKRYLMVPNVSPVPSTLRREGSLVCGVALRCN